MKTAVSLRQKQSIFAFLVARLILFANENQYEVTFGRTYQDPEWKVGTKDSLHKKRLAVDLNLFKNGEYLKTTEAHRFLGEWWERQHMLCRWGGRWDDGNHYEMTERPWRK